MDYYDSEYEKIMMANKCRQEKIHGFQGCKNYGTKCDFGGFYLATYSPEGLCGDCERKEHPERYYGCGSCRMMYRHGFFCWGCSGGISKWLFDLFYNKCEKSKSTTSCYYPGLNETNDWNLWQCIGHGIHSIVHTYDKSPVKPLYTSAPEMSMKWPGFYVGNYQWVTPKITKEQIDIAGINWDNAESILLRELEKNGIFLYEDIQYREI